MKDYKRLTKWSELGTLHVFDINGKEIPLCDVSPIDTDNLAGRLADLEDKIERGELISTVQSEQGEQEIAYFVKHNAAVRKQAVKEFSDKILSVSKITFRAFTDARIELSLTEYKQLIKEAEQ